MAARATPRTHEERAARPPLRRSGELDALVVGSGPNGLAAAIVIARAGYSVTVLEAEPTLGGGARTEALELVAGTELHHDLCSAVHPMGVASPFFRTLDLESLGVEFRFPEVSFAQPLDGGRAGIAYRSLERTVERLGRDGRRWRSLIAPLTRHADTVVELALGDHRSVPPQALRHPLASAAFAWAMLEQGTRLWNARFRTEEARALFTGAAAHAIVRMPSFAASATGLLITALGHEPYGWALPVGGSGAISRALAEELRRLGGTIELSTRVRSEADLPPARVTLFDTSADQVLEILEPRFARAPAGSRARRWADTIRRSGRNNAAAKVDFVLSGPVPWADPHVGLAATVHLGGTRAEMAAAEAAVSAGRHAERPVGLVSDPTITDPDRERDGLRPLWTYAHVPFGSTRDVTEDVTRQIERFAPGFRDVVVASRCIPAAEIPTRNANFLGGDIAAGRVSLLRMLARPTASIDPYRLPFDGMWLCSAAAAPGPGVHGMAGRHAATRALRRLERGAGAR